MIDLSPLNDDSANTTDHETARAKLLAAGFLRIYLNFPDDEND